MTCEDYLQRTLWWLFGYFDGHTPLRGWLYPAPVQWYISAILWVFGFSLLLRFSFTVCFLFFLFFFLAREQWSHLSSLCRDKNHYLYTVHHCLHTVHTLKNIKNGSHSTIHTFKNYFATVLSVFNFSNNKLNPNRPFVFFWGENWYLPLIWKIM